MVLVEQSLCFALTDASLAIDFIICAYMLFLECNDLNANLAYINAFILPLDSQLRAPLGAVPFSYQFPF